MVGPRQALLALTDFNAAGLEVEAAALLVASEAGNIAGNVLYADSAPSARGCSSWRL